MQQTQRRASRCGTTTGSTAAAPGSSASLGWTPTRWPQVGWVPEGCSGIPRSAAPALLLYCTSPAAGCPSHPRLMPPLPLAGDSKGRVRLWDLRRREPVCSLPLPDGATSDLCLAGGQVGAAGGLALAACSTCRQVSLLPPHPSHRRFHPPLCPQQDALMVSSGSGTEGGTLSTLSLRQRSSTQVPRRRQLHAATLYSALLHAPSLQAALRRAPALPSGAAAVLLAAPLGGAGGVHAARRSHNRVRRLARQVGLGALWAHERRRRRYVCQRARS